jgi:hypothetical protein
MSKKFFLSLIFILAGFTLVTQAANPTPAPLNPPTYNYSEANGCTSCHFSSGAAGDHMLEAVGVKIDSTNTVFSFTGNGWFASRHAQSNHGSTQNTFCAKCHSPLEATPQAGFSNGFLTNTDLIQDGKMEGVTCASCHPGHGVTPRVGIYKYGQDKSKLTSYQLLQEGQFDLLCLNCHVARHNEDSPAFKRMYDAGVQCYDCHMAPYGTIVNSTVNKRFHDFKVAQNLPFSCGAKGSVSGYDCHASFSKESTLAFLPYLKQQHSEWWPMNPGANGKRATRRLVTAEDYLYVWQQLEKQVNQ